jgi:hypothetical protein
VFRSFVDPRAFVPIALVELITLVIYNSLVFSIVGEFKVNSFESILLFSTI